MSARESARRILEVLKDRHLQIVTLRELAKRSGFGGAHFKEFKVGFNLLENRGIVKLEQSGWPSEKRGGSLHPKSVVLLADIYEVEDVESELEDIGIRRFSNTTSPTEQIKDERVERLIRRRPCVKCRSFVKDGGLGSCKKYKWAMTLELAQSQELCYTGRYLSWRDRPESA